MDARELRIGNWVLWDNEIVPVDLISAETVNVLHKNSMTGWYTVEINDIIPIPLTEDWLKKFKFEKHPRKDEWMRFAMGGLVLIKYHDVPYYLIETIRNDKITSVQFVHQLQNLYFALTGNELKSV